MPGEFHVIKLRLEQERSTSRKIVMRDIDEIMRGRSVRNDDVAIIIGLQTDSIR